MFRLRYPLSAHKRADVAAKISRTLGLGFRSGRHSTRSVAFTFEAMSDGSAAGKESDAVLGTVVGGTSQTSGDVSSFSIVLSSFITPSSLPTIALTPARFACDSSSLLL